MRTFMGMVDVALDGEKEDAGMEIFKCERR
jgi:hypothetical protein